MSADINGQCRVVEVAPDQAFLAYWARRRIADHAIPKLDTRRGDPVLRHARRSDSTQGT